MAIGAIQLAEELRLDQKASYDFSKFMDIGSPVWQWLLVSGVQFPIGNAVSSGGIGWQCSFCRTLYPDPGMAI